MHPTRLSQMQSPVGIYLPPACGQKDVFMQEKQGLLSCKNHKRAEGDNMKWDIHRRGDIHMIELIRPNHKPRSLFTLEDVVLKLLILLPVLQENQDQLFHRFSRLCGPAGISTGDAVWSH